MGFWQTTFFETSIKSTLLPKRKWVFKWGFKSVVCRKIGQDCAHCMYVIILVTFLVYLTGSNRWFSRWHGNIHLSQLCLEPELYFWKLQHPTWLVCLQNQIKVCKRSIPDDMNTILRHYSYFIPLMKCNCYAICSTYFELNCYLGG